MNGQTNRFIKQRREHMPSKSVKEDKYGVKVERTNAYKVKQAG